MPSGVIVGVRKLSTLSLDVPFETMKVTYVRGMYQQI